jgi:hypothetical protein
MDYQVLFNLSVAVAAFFGGFLLERISRAVERLDGDVRAMPITYVTKDDYKSDIKELKDILGKIFDKLDGKADK